MKSVDLLNVSKRYKKKLVINNISYTFNEGLYLITGENGKGKSTILKLIYGIVKPLSGTISTNGNIIYLPERFKAPNFVTVYEFLSIMITIKHKKKLFENYKESIINEYLNRFEIIKYKQYKMNQLSKGTIQKIMIIYTLINSYDIYLFDEPLNGLDDKSQHEFVNVLKELIANEKIIIISTHYTSVYEDLPNNVLKL